MGKTHREDLYDEETDDEAVNEDYMNMISRI